MNVWGVGLSVLFVMLMSFAWSAMAGVGVIWAVNTLFSAGLLYDVKTIFAAAVLYWLVAPHRPVVTNDKNKA